MRLAFVFPGQGSQAVGMMTPYGESSVIRDTFAEASEALGQDLWRLVHEGPAEELNLTVVTQPAMLTAGVAVYRSWRALGGGLPAMMAGHSLGEYTALVCAEALQFADAIRLVRLRAQAMQSAVPEGVGAMAAVLGLNADAVRRVCLEAAAGEVLEAVNFNSPEQVVIAGHKAAVERSVAVAKALGAKRVLPLPVSVPSHCALMRPAADKLLAAMADMTMRMPSVPVLHNADVAEHHDAGDIRDALARQLYRPVRWVETIQAMHGQGVDMIAECGPGKVLTGLNKRILPDVATWTLADTASMTELLNSSRL